MLRKFYKDYLQVNATQIMDQQKKNIKNNSDRL